MMNTCMIMMMAFFTLSTVCEDGACPHSPQECGKEEKTEPLFPGDEGYLGDGLMTDKNGKRFDFSDRLLPTKPLDVYSKAKFRIRVKKSTYTTGEEIQLSMYVWNDSDTVMNVMPSDELLGINKIKVIDSSGEEMPLTKKGRERQKYDIFHRSASYNASYKFGVALAPDEIMGIGHDCMINDFFEMSKPGTYEITFFRHSIMYAQQYARLLKSNTLKITILDEPVTPEDLKDPGEFRFPAPEKAGDDENAKPDTPCE